jgi:aquaporin Z
MADEKREDPGLTGGSAEGLRRGQALLELEFGKSFDFDDPKHECRRLFSELLGTFFLVLVGAGGAVVNARPAAPSVAPPR